MTQNKMRNAINRGIEIYNNVYYIWYVVFAFILFGNVLLSMFGAIGLSETQKTHPELFNGKYLNFGNLFLFINIYIPINMVFLFASLFALTRKISKIRNSGSVKYGN